MCLKFENLRKIDWKSYFGRSGFNTSVFEKYFILYSCILFIKYYALRCFCIKLLRVFQKNWFFQTFDWLNHVINTIQTFSESFFSLSSIGQDSKQNFCRFPSNFLQGFCLLRLVRPFYPSFFIYFHVSCIFSCILGRISNLWKFGVFDVFNLFFQNWSMGFVEGWYKTDLYDLIWTIWWIGKNWIF